MGSAVDRRRAARWGGAVLALVAPLVALGAASCSTDDAAATAPPSSAADAGGRDGGGDVAPLGPKPDLGPNDVTSLVPLPVTKATPVIMRGDELTDDKSPLVPRALFDRVAGVGASTPDVSAEAYDRLHVVAVRFDLCDHGAPGPCTFGGGARMRLVLQPITDGFGADDVGFHVFYNIPEAEVPRAVASLGELARIQGPTPGPVRPSPALVAGNAEYAKALRAFVARYGGEASLVRMTLNAQPIFAAAIRWTFRGVEKKGGAFEDMKITGTSETLQGVILLNEASYQVTPLVDTPAGLAAAIDKAKFDAAPEAEKRAMLSALAAVDNPLTHGPDTVACVACHASTVVAHTRAKASGIDLRSVSGAYTSTRDLAVSGGKSATTDRTLRALGWLGKEPMISQRVVNDTALVLDDLARR